MSLKLFTNPEAEGKQQFLTGKNASRSYNISTFSSKIWNLKKMKVKKYKRMTVQLPWNYLSHLILIICSNISLMFDLQQVMLD